MKDKQECDKNKTFSSSLIILQLKQMLSLVKPQLNASLPFTSIISQIIVYQVIFNKLIYFTKSKVSVFRFLEIQSLLLRIPFSPDSKLKHFKNLNSQPKQTLKSCNLSAISACCKNVTGSITWPQVTSCSPCTPPPYVLGVIGNVAR